MSEDLLFRPVDELAEEVRSGTISARELVQASLERIAALEPELNAFVDVFADDALAEADAIRPGDERPFAGVPIAIKNNRAVAGRRLTYASDFMGDPEMPYDHNVVARLRAAGFVVVGTTTIPEWGILPWTNTKRFGPTRNPWDPSRTSGGSSGGSGAAVAAGMVPIAHGNDGGGSTRIPAACCGLVGLKPQRDRISFAPEIGENFLTVDGVLTRTVRETAAVLDLLAGAEPGDASWAPPPVEPFAESAGHNPQGLRIVLSVASPLGEAVDPEIVEATRETARLLESLGHHVEEAESVPWAGDENLLRNFTAVFGPMVALQVFQAQMLNGRAPTEEDMEPVSWAIYELSRELSSLDHLAAKTQLELLTRGLAAWREPYDAILTPSLAEAPVELDAVHWQTDDPMGLFARSGRFTPFTAMANITGWPAISLPLHVSESGLPIGSHLIGRPAQEGALLALAAQLEAARPWHDRRAPLAG